MTAVERAATHIIGPVAPDPQDIINATQLTAATPEDEHWAGEASCPTIGFIERKVDGGTSAVVLAHRVDRHGVVEAAAVLGQSFCGKQVSPTPQVERVRVRLNQTFRQVGRLR